MAPNDPRKAMQDKLAREKKEQLQRQNSQQRLNSQNHKYTDGTHFIKTDSKWQNTYLPVIPRLNPDGTFKEN
ncbi:Oidioi.mRNA.OKI2018_I69.PAR.g12354.t1.cds [Oikopleura dioica]|uniref:Oidioi.mRNA.OKI2018_I69.PAR.g12354.t1.cds n=1 Tax=Oikopleura dioica TaxID=34765 RepID=A0ABN7S591_OIKDI|nr:Oidioi.mRNA.OKI2018_I69.PAR.g12354.t1.cds [Oikopleura dioica]